MPVTIGPSGVTNAAVTGGSLAITTPTVRPDGNPLRTNDLLVVVANGAASGGMSAPPAGWAAAFTWTTGANFVGGVYYRYVTGAEAPSYTFGQSNTLGLLMLIASSVTGAVESGNPVDVSALGTNGATASLVTPTLTPTLAQDALVGFAFGQGGSVTSATTSTPPGSMAEVADANSGAASSVFRVSTVAYENLSAAAATGARTFTLTQAIGASSGGGVSFAIKAAPMRLDVGAIPVL